MTGDRRTSSHRWLPSAPLDASRAQPFHIETDRAVRHLFGVPFVEGLHEHVATRFAVGAEGLRLFSCGYWDNSVKCSHLTDGRTLQSLRTHSDVVTCLALSEDGGTLVTGSRDTTLMVWPLVGGAKGGAQLQLPEKPRHRLHGHDDEVMCVSVSSELDTAFSGSRDGSAIVYTLRSGQYVRSILQPAGYGVDLVALSGHGTVLLYSNADTSLHAFTINHRHAQQPLASIHAEERLNALTFNASGTMLLTAGAKGIVMLRRPDDLSLIHLLSASSTGGPAAPLCSLTLTADEQFVLAGTQRGNLLIWGLTTKVIARNFLETLDRTLGLSF